MPPDSADPPTRARQRGAPAGNPDGAAEPIRRRTLVTLRGVALAGQAAAGLGAWLLGARLPVLPVALVIVAAALNLALGLRRQRMTPRAVQGQLILDTVQTGVLLTLTGGTANPFALFVLAPLTLGAGVLSRRALIALAATTAGMIVAMTVLALPLEMRAGSVLTAGMALGVGHVLALAIGGAFFASSAYRISADLAATENALWAAQMGLAREQRLQHLGGVVAAAAHEMGTPLATIKLVAAELADELSDLAAERPDLAEDLALLRSSADRCREILRSMGAAGKDDLHLHSAPLEAVLEEAAAPHRDRGRRIVISDRAGIIVRRDAGLIHALRNLIQNAVDFAAGEVRVDAAREGERIRLTIRDDGPGFPPHLRARLGEPYLTTRRPVPGQEGPGYEGLGLGLFIARTLIERSGGQLAFANDGGAVVAVTWPASALIADDRAILPSNPAIQD